MKLFGRREVKTAVPLTAISDLRAAQWSGAGQLTREGFERNAVAYRCVRMIAKAAASVGFRDVGGDDALVRLIAKPNGEQAGPDLLETFYGHLSVTVMRFSKPCRWRARCASCSCCGRSG